MDCASIRDHVVIEALDVFGFFGEVNDQMKLEDLDVFFTHFETSFSALVKKWQFDALFNGGMLLPLYQINGMEIERDFLVLVPFKIDLIPINLQYFLINQKIMLLVFAQSTRNEIPKWNLDPPCFFSWVNVSLFRPDS